MFLAENSSRNTKNLVLYFRFVLCSPEQNIHSFFKIGGEKCKVHFSLLKLYSLYFLNLKASTGVELRVFRVLGHPHPLGEFVE